MRRILSAAAFAICLAVLPRDTAAQASYQLTLAPGTPIRITTAAEPGKRLRGEAVAVRGDTLVMMTDDSRSGRAYALRDLRTLEIRSGLDRKRGMLYGAIGGLVFGASLGSEERASTATGMALIGSLAGFAFAPAAWQHLPLPVQ